MIEEVVLATRNKGKVKEFADLLQGVVQNVISLDNLDNPPDVVEDGDTFKENALKKARAIAEYSGKPALADDSGLVVPALGGQPGVYSARYAGERATDTDNIEKLLSELGEESDRRAKFVCVLALVFPDREKAISYFKSFTNLSTIFTDLPIRRVYLVNFIIYLALFGFYRVIQMYMVGEWHFPTDKVTLYYAFLAVIAGIANTFFFGPLSKRFGLKQITIWCATIGGLFIISIVIPKSEISYWFTAGPAAFITVMAVAGCGAYLSTLVRPERQGRVLGNNLALQVGAESMSAALGGFLAAILIPLPLLFYGTLSVLGGLLLITYKGKGDFEGE